MTCTAPDRSCDRDTPPRPGRTFWGVAVLLALAAAPLFCHGCHGHGDDDLSGWLAPRPAGGETGR